MLVHHDLGLTAATRPNKIALVENEKHCCFQEWDQLSDTLACTLQALGIKRGDRVAIMMDNSIAMVIALYGILKSGAAFTLVHPSTKPEKLKFMLNDCTVKVLIAQANLERVVLTAVTSVPSLTQIIWSGRTNISIDGLSFEAIVTAGHIRPRDPELIDKDLCAIIYTSGSTGFPKGVTLTHHNLCNTSRLYFLIHWQYDRRYHSQCSALDV